jgi:hypothetical protein
MPPVVAAEHVISSTPTHVIASVQSGNSIKAMMMTIQAQEKKRNQVLPAVFAADGTVVVVALASSEMMMMKTMSLLEMSSSH